MQRFQCKYSIVCEGTVETTGYGRVGPSTLAKIEAQQGIGGGPTVPPATGDVNAPIINPPTMATSSNTAIITWTTSESATSRVMYATSWPFLFASSGSAGTPGVFSKNASVTLSGLTPNTTYFYVLESVDASGNLQWSFNHSFRTSQ